MHTFLLFFGWPNGGVWSNLVASVLSLGAGALWARWKFFARLEAWESAHKERHEELKSLIGDRGDGR